MDYEIMVANVFYFKLLKQLEKFLLKKVNFRMAYDNYDLILVVPTDEIDVHRKYSILLSSKIFDTQSQRELITQFLEFFKKSLTDTEYQSISRINIIKSNEPFVSNINLIFKTRTHAIEISNVQVGGIQIDKAFLLKSLVLDRLKTNYATTFVLTDGSIINAGIDKITSNYEILIYTGKGLRELWKPQMNEIEQQNAEELRLLPEQELISKEYMALIPLDDIAVIN